MIINNTTGTALSTAFNNAIDSNVLSQRARVTIDWSDSRHLENTVGSNIESVAATTNDAHASTVKGSLGYFCGPAQAANGWERQGYLWGVAGAKDVNGHVIRADGNWSAMPDEDKMKYEFGWWSGTRSNASGGFTTDPYVQLDFDSARVTHIKVNTSEYYGQVSSIKVEYKKAGESSWTVHSASASIVAGSYSYESAINNEDFMDLIGIKITALATRNKEDYARFNEIVPIYREDVSNYITALDVSKVHTLHNSSLPIGATAANNGSIKMDNTSRRFSPFSTSGVGKYVRKDVKINIDMGVLVDEANNTYEYVPMGSYWVDNWDMSADMQISGQFRDFTKFLSEFLIDDGFLIQDVLAGKAVHDLVLKSNFPKGDVNYLKRFDDEVIERGGVLHYSFRDGNAFNEAIATNTAEDGVWAHWWNKSQEKWTQIEGISKEYDALRDTVKNINTAETPLVREIVSVASGDALNISGLNNGSAGVFASAQTSGGNPYHINARFYTHFVPSSTASTQFKFTVKNGGVKVRMDDVLILDEYTNMDGQSNVDKVYTVDVGSLRAGAAYKIVIDYYHWLGTQKLVWQYATGGSYTDVQTSNTKLAVTKDSIGIRDHDTDHYNHGVYTDSAAAVALNNGETGMVSNSDSRSSLFSNSGNSNYQHVVVPYDASYNLALSTAENYTGEYSIEVLAQFDDPIGGKGVYAGNIDNANSATKGIGLFHTSAANGVYLRDGSATLTVSNNVTTDFSSSKWTHIVATYDGTTLKYYVNGALKGSAVGSGHTSWASQSFNIGKSTDDSSGSSADYYFDGNFDECVLYNEALTADEVLQNYYVINMKELPVYDHLFGDSVDVFSLMQEITTADLGMFYFNEYNKFNYYHYNRFYEDFIDEHASVQKSISDELFIMSGSTPIDIQANKITITVNNPTLEAVGKQPIWRAPSPTTVTVAGLAGDMDATQISVSVTTTDGEYPWYDSGYFRIDDEIMQYNSKTSNSLDGLKRGMFGTAAAIHTAVVDGVTTKVREVKYFAIKYSQAPALDVRIPLIAAIASERTPLVYLDVWEPTPFGAELVISATNDVKIGDLVYIEGKNKDLGLDYYASIAGVPINVKSSSEQVVQQSESNSPSIRKYGLKAIEITNKFITSATWADILATFIRDKFQDVIMILSIDIAGVPQLQLGDRIKIEAFDNLSIANKEYWVIEISNSFNGALTQQLKLREAS
jgi:hypothetical protein